MSVPGIVDRVEKAWRTLGDPLPGMVIALSGGPDSVALSCALLEARKDGDSLFVLAHLNHQLRGAESDGDEAFVVNLQRQFVSQGLHRIEVVCQRRDIGALALSEGENLEAVARRERYHWLAETARRYGLSFIATGHTANDQAETVLHRLIRGTGIDGLRGIAFRREIEPGIEIVRPLLQVTRAEVESYLHSLALKARQDATNEDPRFTRNRIRRDLIPLLEREYNPRVVEVLTQLASQAAEISEAEEQAAGAVLQATERPRAGTTIVLDVETLSRTPRRLIRGVLRLIWQRENWPMREMGFREYERVTDLIFQPTGAHDLPGGIRVRRRRYVLQMEQSVQRSNSSPPDRENGQGNEAEPSL